MPVRQTESGLRDQGTNQLHEAADVPERQDAESVGWSRKGSAEPGRGRIERLPGVNHKSRISGRPAGRNQNPGQFRSNCQVDRRYLRTRPIFKRRVIRQLYPIRFQSIDYTADLQPRSPRIN
jgi:hypothetical protein